jgi:hypothetical protein
MSSINIGSWTLEHDREWRAWRRLVTGDVIQKGDEYDMGGRWVAATKFDRTYNAGGGWLPYRRPVPLPSIGGLMAALKRKDHWYQVPHKGEWIKATWQAALSWLRDLLPGYEEQLAKERPEVAARPAEGVRPAQPSPVPADGWRTIETAPKDGTDVLLGGPGKRRVGRWMGRSWVVHETSDARWVMEGATHWQPLPPPPQEKGGEA